jgi:hypothetical protein
MALSTAELQRRYRERVRNGLRVVPVVINAAIVEDALIRRRFLKREDADNPAAIADALQEAVAALIVPPDEPEDSVMHNAIDSRTVA